MTAQQFQAAIDELGLSQLAAARFLKVGDRTARRYASGDSEIPLAVAGLLMLMIEEGWGPRDVWKLLGRKWTE